MSKELLYEWRYLIIGILGLGVYSVFYWQKVKQYIYGLMIDAEKLARKHILNSGKEKEDWVINKLKLIFPKLFLFPYTEQIARYLIGKIIYRFKDFLDDGEINGSIPKDVI